jgi:hypothetical protein
MVNAARNEARAAVVITSLREHTDMSLVLPVPFPFQAYL